MKQQTIQLKIRNPQTKKAKTLELTVPTGWEIVQAIPGKDVPEAYLRVLPDPYDVATSIPFSNVLYFLLVFSRKNHSLRFLGEVHVFANPDERGVYRFAFGGWDERTFLKHVGTCLSLVKQIKAGCLPKKAYALFQTGIGAN